MSSTGCGVIGHKEQVDQAEDALEKGNVPAAIKITKQILGLYPNNFWAKRTMKKIEAHVLTEARDAMEAKNYKLAADKARIALNINAKNEEALAIQKDAKKNLALASAQMFMAGENPVNALKALNNALKLDPAFEEAKQMKAKIDKLVEDRINNFLGSADEMMEQGKYKEIETMAQGFLAIDPQNQQISDLLLKAKDAILKQDKEDNLNKAREAYAEGLYESAQRYAEKVLKIDEGNKEALEFVENCGAELLKPALRLTGFYELKGSVYASIMVAGIKEPFRVREGDEFGDFKVSAIDRDLGAVVVKYTITESLQTIMMDK
jgi:tetratricopeptide (TPR) repeat protein